MHVEAGIMRWSQALSMGEQREQQYASLCARLAAANKFHIIPVDLYKSSFEMPV
jgi:hypothetical protein